MRRRRTEVMFAIGIGLAVVTLTTQALSTQPPAAPAAYPASAETRRPVATGTVTATPPFSIDVGTLLTIHSLPTALTDAIAAATFTTTEIIDAKQTAKVPLEPMAPPIDEGWCISVYPEVTITLYVQRYVAPPGKIWVTAGDYIPGEQHTGSIDHFFALKRRGAWELYHPEVYSWSSLGCT